uniref:Reverse transcriptase domain-containing protein n=1 Tax=Tanacetum cinerariifolium TaxID=118510 RepID=A0A699HDI1_TANCI|nr:reverse transcriptase domain-containing protein [Tanacetum cinerariifolium]
MVGGNLFNTEHKLNEYKHIKPVKQKKRGLALERNEAACKEVDELTKAGILREVKDHTWVANPVMVKKSDGGWRMCVDVTDINKACPKDSYPLPEIKWKVESLSGFQLKCFLDAYKGYHQIQMVEGDKDKTNFFIGKGVFCYRKMPFGLKNTGATYQRLVDKVFNNQLGQNLEAYVDDMLNLKKCSFNVEEGSFLGHLITKQGIKANPSKVKEITDLKPPRTLKEIQILNGKLAALNRFFSKGADNSLLLFKALKSCTDKKTIQWTAEREKKTSFDLLRKEDVTRGIVKLSRVGEAHISPRSRFKETSKKKKDIDQKSKAANKEEKLTGMWKLYNDEASSFEGKEYTYALRFEFETTNNEAEYEALLASLRIAEEMEIKDLALFIDS